MGCVEWIGLRVHGIRRIAWYMYKVHHIYAVHMRCGKSPNMYVGRNGGICRVHGVRRVVG